MRQTGGRGRPSSAADWTGDGGDCVVVRRRCAAQPSRGRRVEWGNRPAGRRAGRPSIRWALLAGWVQGKAGWGRGGTAAGGSDGNGLSLLLTAVC